MAHTRRWTRTLVSVVGTLALIAASVGSIARAQDPILPIGTVQGSVGDTANGTAFRSPYAPASGGANGQTVTVQGVIYQRTLARASSGASQYGFFIQNTAATADADGNSADGIFVFHSTFATTADRTRRRLATKWCCAGQLRKTSTKRS